MIPNKQIEREIKLAKQAHLYTELSKRNMFGSKLQVDLNKDTEDEIKDTCRSLLIWLEKEFGEYIKGQPEMVHILLLALVLNEHALLEGLPGVGKTEMVKWIAHVTGLPFQRVQFIPDMLPSDLIGKDRIDPVGLHRGSPDAVKWVSGPLFTSVLLADEINRAPSKVQAALLEAMGENQITPFGKISRVVLSPIHEAALNVWWDRAPDGRDEDDWPRGILGLPAIEPERKDLAQFNAFATMNPIEQEGTYPLSEAQIDRFCFKIVVPYPSRDVYPMISGVVYSGNKPPDALEPQCSRTEYEEYFRQNEEAMRAILGPIYFFLLCRSFVRPIKIKVPKKKGQKKVEWQRIKPVIENSMFEVNREAEGVKKIYDAVLMTNAKTPSEEGVAKRRPIYTEKEQVELRAYINNLSPNENKRDNLLAILRCRHCQYVLAGASPRGFFKLLAAALCEAFIRGQDLVEDKQISVVVHAVLRHRVHMDVHARLENIDPVDVLDAVCDRVLNSNYGIS